MCIEYSNDGAASDTPSSVIVVSTINPHLARFYTSMVHRRLLHPIRTWKIHHLALPRRHPCQRGRALDVGHCRNLAVSDAKRCSRTEGSTRTRLLHDQIGIFSLKGGALGVMCRQRRRRHRGVAGNVRESRWTCRCSSGRRDTWARGRPTNCRLHQLPCLSGPHLTSRALCQVRHTFYRPRHTLTTVRYTLCRAKLHAVTRHTFQAPPFGPARIGRQGAPFQHPRQ